MEVYDFILFENYFLATNHYKDICIIAKLLKRCGYSVAIADVFGEGDHCIVEDVSHIKFTKKCPVPITEYSSRFGLLKGLVNTYRRMRIASYLKYVLLQLQGKYRHLYAGSYYSRMSTKWLGMIPSNSSAFFWGLRSSRLIEHELCPHGRTAVSSRRLRSYFDKHQNLKFFVSDEIIRKEFLDLVLSPLRLVIRPERIIDELPCPPENKHAGLNLLSIGSIRESKRIEMILDCLKELGDADIHYIIAGKASSEYNEIIAEHSKGMYNVKRLDYRIPDSEYDTLLEQCDFLVLCDKKQKSSVTNGTMNEALQKGVPIIAPDYNPYKYYIEKYGVGLVFDPSKPQSLANAITEAKKRGRASYYDSICKYDETYLWDRVVQQFKKELSKSL